MEPKFKRMWEAVIYWGVGEIIIPLVFIPNINSSAATSNLIRLIAEHTKCSSLFLQALMVVYTSLHLTGMGSASCIQWFPKTHFRKIKYFQFVYERLGSAATIEFITQWPDFVRCSWDHTKTEIVSPFKMKITVSTLHVFPKLQLYAVFVALIC